MSTPLVPHFIERLRWAAAQCGDVREQWRHVPLHAWAALMDEAADKLVEAAKVDETLNEVAACLEAMKSCERCVEWAAKGLPFCTPHALTLGGLIGERILGVADTMVKRFEDGGLERREPEPIVIDPDLARDTDYYDGMGR